MRICIVTTGHLSTNPRVVKEAAALVEAGHAVTVIRGHYAPWAVAMDADLEAQLGVQVKPVAFGPRLAPRWTYLVQTFRRRSALALWKAGLRTLQIATTASFPASYEYAATTRAIAADMYIGHYVGALPAAAQAAERTGVPFVFDAEDFHPGDPPEGPEHEDERSLIETILRAYLPRAAGVTAASPLMAQAYAAAFRVPEPTVVLNVFPEPGGGLPPSETGTIAPGPSVYWVSQTIGEDRGLEEAVQACAMARSRPHLYLRGNVEPGYRSHLEGIAVQGGAGGHVHFLPLAPPQELETLASGFDVGLCSDTGLTKNRDIALTNKIFSYLVAGIPVIMSDTLAHRHIAPELGDGCRIYRRGDPASLAAVLDGLLGDRGALTRARASAHRAGRTRFNWNVEKGRLVAFIEGTAATWRRA